LYCSRVLWRHDQERLCNKLFRTFAKLLHMELERPRKMELLHTPKFEVLRLLREYSLTIDEVVFLLGANKLGVADVRINAPTICDKLLEMFLRQIVKKQQAASAPHSVVA